MPALRRRLLRWLLPLPTASSAELEAAYRRLNDRLDKHEQSLSLHAGSLLQHRCWVEALVEHSSPHGSARGRYLRQLYEAKVRRLREQRDGTPPPAEPAEATSA